MISFLLLILLCLVGIIIFVSLRKHNIPNSQIHPELKFFGIIIREFWSSFSVGKFKFCEFLLRRTAKILFHTKHSKCKNIYLLRNDGTKLRVCVYIPKNKKENVPGILWIHGGGYALSMPELDSHYYENFISEFGCVIISPDYRTSIESPYPSALEDCYNSLLWMKDHLKEFGIRDDQIFIGGDSAGGGLTIATTLLARDRGEVSIAFQMPVFPMMDDRMITASSQNNDSPVWNTKSNVAAWKLYLGDLYGTDKVDKYAAPAREIDYSNLPPALSYVGTIDPFYDETVQYINNLKSNGIKTIFKEYKGCFHGFDVFSWTSLSKDAHKFLIDGFRYAMSNYSKKQPSC